jgi:hypothetical protein
LSSSTPGGAAVTTDLLRPYRGIGSISTIWGTYWNGYDSIQTSFNRRFRNGVQATLNYTLGLRTIGTTSSPLRLQHAPDGSFSIRADQAEADELLRNTGNRPHVIRGQFVWDLPDVASEGVASKILAAVTNDWQVSGVFTGTSGSGFAPSFSYQSAGSSVNLTGSPSYPARIRVVGDPGSGCSSNQYAQFNTSAFAGPTYGSVGLESGANLMRGCFQKITDLSIARNIRLGGARSAQLRVDLFNAFNTVVIDSRENQLQLTNPTAQVIRNNQFLADGSVNPSRLRPEDAGFGAADGAMSMRTVQVELRFRF